MDEQAFGVTALKVELELLNVSVVDQKKTTKSPGRGVDRQSMLRPVLTCTLRFFSFALTEPPSSIRDCRNWL